MTRRVRFTSFLRVGVFAAVTMAVGFAEAADLPLVPQPPIATGVDVRAAAAMDIDGDGDADLVATGLNAVHWYENVGGTWTQRTIHAITALIASATTADVDGDGDIDVLSTAFQANSVFWHENTAGNGSAWTVHTITTAATGARDVETGDVDGDGDPDVLAGSLGRVAWFENTGSPSIWPMRTVMTQVEAPAGVVPVDVDGDGDLDVVTSGFENAFGSALLYWAENAANGVSWTVRSVFSLGYAGSAHAAAADLNGDGDVDLVLGHSGALLRWFENAAGNGTAWTPQTIAAIQAEGLPITGDIDGDGDQDILAGFRGTSDDHTFWFENTAGDGSAWTRRTVATSSERGPSAFVSADLDRDGDNDILLGTGVDDRLVWFRNDSLHRSACFGAGVAVATDVVVPNSVAVADVDGDGGLDVLASSSFDATLRWHDNVAGDGSAWLPHIVATSVNQVLSMAAADVDGDGDGDVLSAPNGRILWHDNLAGSGTTWAVRTVSLVNGSEPVSLDAADMDGDGDVDVVSAGYTSGNEWFANTAGNGSAWTPTTIGGATPAMAVGNLDGDGDLDVAASVGFFQPFVRWYANTLANGSMWSLHTVTTIDSMESNDIVAADLDADGDSDLIEAFHGIGIRGLRWFGNLGGAGLSWSTGTISTDAATSVAVGDLDRDGDLDAFSTGSLSLALSWHENAGGAAAWTQHAIPVSLNECRALAVGDIDRDGDLDVVGALPQAHRIDWFANRGGQFALDVADIAPPGAQNAVLAPMLRVVVTHRGRAGDGNLELASLGVRLEEDAGDPLTTAEANAIIESLRVYLDANGSGLFEPGADVLVTSVPTLALVAGVQSVPFADGDANVQVDFGTPRTFFVVTELTADASLQSPNRFRVTLLGQGPAASAAEDRSYDIALAPACPADVSSSVLGPITPVTLMRFSVE